MSSNVEYDIIFAGGGTAGCLAAGRLAAANPSLRILILEAGPHTLDVEEHIQPARCVSLVQSGSKAIWNHVAQPTPDLGNRSLIVHSGKCVGGGSSVNFMMYTRGAASDYDDWERIYHNPGWSFKDLLPLFRKTETYQVKAGEATHGYSGPLKVSYGGVFTNVGKECMDVAGKYEKGREFVEDTNDFSSCNGYSHWQKWIDEETGRRSDVAHNFIYNQKDNPNLSIFAGKVVKRVVIEDGRAVGVEYMDDRMPDSGFEGPVQFARATRLVVVSAGAFGSPTILERSGIGSARVLKKNNVDQIVDLPGVGENFQDHPIAFPAYLSSNDAETVDGIFFGDAKETSDSLTEWKASGTGLLAHNTHDVGLKLRPNAEELQELGLGFQTRWTTDFAHKPDKPALVLAVTSGFLGSFLDVPARKYIGACYFICYPLSIGHVHIASQDPFIAPEFHSGLLDNSTDLAILRLAYKKSREIIRRLSFYRGELVSQQPQFPLGSEAVCKDVDGPAPVDAQDLVYSAEDNAAIDKFHREMVASARHSLGTCSMRPQYEGGVVDHFLNVYGVRGLKVADLSIAPSNIGGNTYSSALVIGEQAAMIIAKELGLRGL